MNRVSFSAIGLCALALLAAPLIAPAAAPQERSSQAQEKSKQDKDVFDKAGEATKSLHAIRGTRPRACGRQPSRRTADFGEFAQNLLYSQPVTVRYRLWETASGPPRR